MRHITHTASLVAASLGLFLAPTDGFAKGKRIEAEAPLVATVRGPLGASGTIRLELKGARVDFKVELEDLPAGVYDLFVEGVNVGMIVAAPDGGTVNGEIKFRSPLGVEPSSIALTFDPTGKTIQIMQGGVVIMGGAMPAGS